MESIEILNDRAMLLHLHKFQQKGEKSKRAINKIST